MNSLSIHLLAYQNDLTLSYQALMDLPGFVLLESSDKQQGRYDIVAACPYDSLVVPRDKACLSDALSLFQSKLPQITTASDLPFQGGAIGYISYDFGAMLAGIQSNVHPSNEMPLIDMRFYDWAIVTDHYLKQVSLVAAHTQTETATIIQEVRERWGKKLNQHSFCLKQTFKPLISHADYLQGFNHVYQALVAGRAYQVNYTQAFMAHYEGSAWEMYKRVKLKNPVPYSAFMRCKDADIVCFSPEQFLLLEKDEVYSSPIKGTIKRSNDPTTDKILRDSLLNSEKNRAENTMIVDLLRNDLGRFAKPGSVEVTHLCELQSFNAVHHLVSRLKAQPTTNTSLADMWSACFPGGSITGAPKREAMQIIHEEEAYARGVYCGSLAYFSNHGRFDSNIAIRTVVAKEDTLYLAAGGGIVIDSSAEDEYRESLIKIKAIVDAC